MWGESQSLPPVHPGVRKSRHYLSTDFAAEASPATTVDFKLGDKADQPVLTCDVTIPLHRGAAATWAPSV